MAVTPHAARWRLPELPTPSRPDVPVIGVEAMRAVDRTATDELGLSLLQMMENAGFGLAELTRLTLGGSVVRRSVVVLAGTGSNAGGGLVAARRLAGWGADVRVVFTHPILRLRPGPCAQVEPMLAAGVQAAVVEHDRSIDALRAEVEGADAVLDAVIGYSLRGALRDEAAAVIGIARAGAGAVISLDVPSGIEAATGSRPGIAVAADATLTLALPKPGLLVGEGARYTGARYLADIGVPAAAFARVGIDTAGVFDAGPLLRLD